MSVSAWVRTTCITMNDNGQDANNMHAVLEGDNKKLQWTEVPDPQIREDEVLLQIHAAALNRADLLQRAGQYPPPAGWPA